MEKDIVLFYYYSSPSVPEGCFLQLSSEIAYRNLLLLPCPGYKIHFEFPMFEDHSYNTICNRVGLRNLLQRPNNDKYIIFRTGDQNIVGFYHVRRAYYQETNMFNNNGFVWGVEADPYLIRKGVIKYKNLPLRQGFKASWHKDKWAEVLNELLLKIQEEENLSNIYKSEANRLVRLLKSREEMRKWQEYCISCRYQSNCALKHHFDKYNREHEESDIFHALNNVYNSNLYSRSVLTGIPKIYLKVRGGLDGYTLYQM